MSRLQPLDTLLLVQQRAFEFALLVFDPLHFLLESLHVLAHMLDIVSARHPQSLDGDGSSSGGSAAWCSGSSSAR
jgi:hypothetical protein